MSKEVKVSIGSKENISVTALNILAAKQPTIGEFSAMLSMVKIISIAGKKSLEDAAQIVVDNFDRYYRMTISNLVAEHIVDEPEVVAELQRLGVIKK